MFGTAVAVNSRYPFFFVSSETFIPKNRYSNSDLRFKQSQFPSKSSTSRICNGNFESEIEVESEMIDSDEEFLVSCSRDIEEGFEIEVEKFSNGRSRRRRIRSRIVVDAELEAVWRVLTDYEGLADFIPGLLESKLVDRGDKFARLFQVGQQDLALGLKFNAKGVIDCYEMDLDNFPGGCRRDIEFKMVEGDFLIFEGRWSIEQSVSENLAEEQGFDTTLSYVVELEPKRWLPVRVVEGRLCKEVKKNLIAVRNEAQRVQRIGIDAAPIC